MHQPDQKNRLNSLQPGCCSNHDPGSVSHESWAAKLRQIYDQAVALYKQGTRNPFHIVDSTHHGFLGSIGMSIQELFDFVEDGVSDGEPTLEEALRISEIRKEYFQRVQQGKPSTQRLSASDFPSGQETLGGHQWLPRLIAKAQAKLRGELPDDLMYGCAADRRFLRPLGIQPSEFLGKVWEYEEQKDRLVDFVTQRQNTFNR